MRKPAGWPIHHVDFLFRTARGRLEKLLAGFRNQKILVRSFFLNRHGFISECYDNGLADFYRFMYPKVGPLKGYLEAGLSFFNSGFHQNALEAFKEGIAFGSLKRPTTGSVSRMLKSLQSHAEKAEAALKKTREANALSVDTESTFEP